MAQLQHISATKKKYWHFNKNWLLAENIFEESFALGITIDTQYREKDLSISRFLRALVKNSIEFSLNLDTRLF